MLLNHNCRLHVDELGRETLVLLGEFKDFLEILMIGLAEFGYQREELLVLGEKEGEVLLEGGLHGDEEGRAAARSERKLIKVIRTK